MSATVIAAAAQRILETPRAVHTRKTLSANFTTPKTDKGNLIPEVLDYLSYLNQYLYSTLECDLVIGLPDFLYLFFLYHPRL